jgi:hypothetical protein
MESIAIEDTGKAFIKAKKLISILWWRIDSHLSSNWAAKGPKETAGKVA